MDSGVAQMLTLKNKKNALEKVSFLSIKFLFSFEKINFMAEIGRIFSSLSWPIKLMTKVMIFLERGVFLF